MYPFFFILNLCLWLLTLTAIKLSLKYLTIIIMKLNIKAFIKTIAVLASEEGTIECLLINMVILQKIEYVGLHSLIDYSI